MAAIVQSCFSILKLNSKHKQIIQSVLCLQMTWVPFTQTLATSTDCFAKTRLRCHCALSSASRAAANAHGQIQWKMRAIWECQFNHPAAVCIHGPENSEERLSAIKEMVQGNKMGLLHSSTKMISHAGLLSLWAYYAKAMICISRWDQELRNFPFLYMTRNRKCLQRYFHSLDKTFKWLWGMRCNALVSVRLNFTSFQSRCRARSASLRSHYSLRRDPLSHHVTDKRSNSEPSVYSKTKNLTNSWRGFHQSKAFLPRQAHCAQALQEQCSRIPQDEKKVILWMLSVPWLIWGIWRLQRLETHSRRCHLRA